MNGFTGIKTSPRHLGGRRWKAVTGAAILVAGGAVAAPASTAAAESASDVTPATAVAAEPTIFTYTGAEQTYTVPAGVNQLYIRAYGAPGGEGPGTDFVGGGSAVVTATVPVVPGATLYVEVGGRGGDGGGGGFNGGGHGVAGGGGGASDVRGQPRSVPLTTVDSRIVVAGGGGGTAYSPGGDAGYDEIAGAGDGGKGALVVPGSGGNGGLGPPAGSGGPGKLGPDGLGGKLGVGGDSSWMAGGGGGGGYYGGGGGGGGPFGGGGGAGSSYWVGTATATMWEGQLQDPKVEISPVATPMVMASLLEADVAALDLPRGIETKLLARVAEVRAAVAAGDRDLVVASVNRLLDTVDALRANVLRHSADEWQALVARATDLRALYPPTL